MGDGTITLRGSEEDYNYKMSCGMGDLTVNGESYADLSGSYKVTNAGAVGTIDLDCGMGSIDFDIESEEKRKRKHEKQKNWPGWSGFGRVKKRYPGPQEEKTTLGPGFVQKTGLAEEKIRSGPVLHGKSAILTGK